MPGKSKDAKNHFAKRKYEAVNNICLELSSGELWFEMFMIKFRKNIDKIKKECRVHDNNRQSL